VSDACTCLICTNQAHSAERWKKTPWNLFSINTRRLVFRKQTVANLGLQRKVVSVAFSVAFPLKILANETAGIWRWSRRSFRGRASQQRLSCFWWEIVNILQCWFCLNKHCRAFDFDAFARRDLQLIHWALRQKEVIC